MKSLLAPRRINAELWSECFSVRICWVCDKVRVGLDGGLGDRGVGLARIGQLEIKDELVRDHTVHSDIEGVCVNVGRGITRLILSFSELPVQLASGKFLAWNACNDRRYTTACDLHVTPGRRDCFRGVGEHEIC